MCGRFTLHTEKELLQREFQVDLSGVELAPSYNVAPSQDVLTVREKDHARVARKMRWGLVPYWSKPLEKLPPMINARRETIATRPAYRRAFRRRRCLVLADGFYEWQSIEKAPKQPYWVALADGRPFAMAAVWDVWRAPDEPEAEPLVSCSIVTAPANRAIAMLHDRMPVILTPERADAWIDHAFDDRADELLALLEPVAAGAIVTRPVSTDVNKPEHDDPHLIDEVQPAAPTLF
jgi:putative SOS response-associated peptidase YedK